jgi:hypothetical protein
LDGNQDGICSGEGIECQNIERWRAVDQDEVVFFAERLDKLPKTILAILHGDELDCSADQVLVRRNEVQQINLRVDGYALNRLAEDQRLI